MAELFFHRYLVVIQVKATENAYFIEKVTMKKLAFLLMIVLIFGFTNEIYDNQIKNIPTILTTPRKESCSVQNVTFQARERIAYSVYYNWGVIWIPAGEAIFKVDDDGNQYHF
ncbi:MAG: hypothetical protein ACI9XO_002018 [Paraglaciecola sp.]